MKKKILPIVITIIALIVLGVSIYYINKPTVTDTRGEITIILIDKDLNEIDNKKIKFEEGNTFVELLNNNYDIVVEDGMLLKIGSLEAYNTEKEFIKIYIECDPSNKGIKLMTPKNGTTYRFVIEEVKASGYDTKFC